MYYKVDNNELLQGETICSPIVTLTKKTKDEFTYPQDGWYWFDLEDEAYSFFGLEKEVENEYQDNIYR